MERDAFLAAIRSRVREASPVALPSALPRTMVSADDDGADRFAAELQAVGGECHRVEPAGLRSAVASVAAELEKAVVGADLDGRRGTVVEGLREAGCVVLDAGRKTAAEADLGVTSAVLGVASTGSVLLSSADGHRSTSLLPPAHLAILDEHAIVPGFEELMVEIARRARDAAHLAVITGPSRTSDIEMTTVRGVHGPERVIVLLVAKE